jgi:hypothetical protein
VTAPACPQGGSACSYRRAELLKADALWEALTAEREQSRAYRLQLQDAQATVAALEARGATYEGVLATLDAAVRAWRGGRPAEHTCADAPALSHTVAAHTGGHRAACGLAPLPPLNPPKSLGIPRT